MQMVFPFDDRPERLRAIHAALRKRFGQPIPPRLLFPVSQLVMGLISSRTTGPVSKAAFLRLARRFRTWRALPEAPVGEIAKPIAAVTDPARKAQRLRTALQQIVAREGRVTLAFLAPMPVGHALWQLERLPGVGRKTAAATLNFSLLRKPALVIDTHHLRVMARLGFVGEKSQAERAYNQLMPVLPAEWRAEHMDDHHELVKRLGQTHCRPSRPACPSCPVRTLCPSGSQNRREAAYGDPDFHRADTDRWPARR